jgi:glycosyltransferase involved in cell wall biosynthesis
MKALVCLPVYNEEHSIGDVIKHIQQQGLDLVVVDGQSHDKSVLIAQSLGAEVVQRDGLGKGSAVIKGMQIAVARGYDFLLLIDCDSSYPVRDLIKLTAFEASDMVVGVRQMRDIEFKRRVANLVMTKVLNLLYNASLKDMASGMRALKVSKFAGVLTAKRFDIEPQICSIALKKKYEITEVDIEYYPRKGESKIGILDFFDALWRMFKERFK